VKKLFLASMAIIALAAGPASAADLSARPVYKAPKVAPVAPVFSWTGCYFGGNAGAVWGRTDITYQETGLSLLNDPRDQAFANSLGSPTFHETRFTAGGQVGCNYQTSSLWVIGIESDLNWVGLNDHYFASGNRPVNGNRLSSTVTAKSDYLFTLRPRVGFAAGPALFYVTGGLAVGNEQFSQRFFHFASLACECGSLSTTRAGWTAGGGFEYVITTNWSAKIEYLHVELGRASFIDAQDLFPPFTANNSMRVREDIVRAGVNYRFAWGKAPIVVARY
jgi:outer membrane immunogenic protein